MLCRLFSLFTLWLRAEQKLSLDCRALLIDGDSRSEAAVSRLIELNRLHGRVSFQQGLISDKLGSHTFIERSFMNSSLGGDAADGVTKRVSTVSADQILDLLPPPYDLIKIDVEGGEFEFLNAYESVLSRTDYLLMEWHSWHAGGGGVGQLQELLDQRNFEFVTEVLRPEDESHRHGVRSSGVHLYRRR